MAKDWSKHSAQHLQGQTMWDSKPGPWKILDAAGKREKGTNKDHLTDHERAHSGQPGAKVKHGTDAAGRVPSVPMRNMRDFDRL